MLTSLTSKEKLVYKLLIQKKIPENSDVQFLISQHQFHKVLEEDT